MKTSRCTLINAITHLDYQELRQISPEVARRAVIACHRGYYDAVKGCFVNNFVD